jgi:uncharacterized membrane protein required for colicin V production
MLLDILIGIPMLIFILLGLRDGVVRKLVAIVVLIAGLVLGQIFMHDIGQFLSDNGWIRSSNPFIYGFLIIFMGMVILQGLLYKILAGGYKIGGFADRIGGMIFGFIEGALFISSLLFIFALSGFPSRETRRDARLYAPIVNIAPQILDFTSSLGPDSFQKVKGFDSSSGIDGKKKVMKMDNPRSSEGRKNTNNLPAVLDTSSNPSLNARKGNEILDEARKSVRK